MSESPRDRLASLIEPVVTASGYDLEAVSVSQAGRRGLVRVVVDGDDGVALDDVAALSKAISAALDEHDGLMGRAPYTLEVTSPGVDRPLTLPRHWRRAVGRLVRVEVDGERPFQGRVVAAGEDGVDLHVDGERRRVGYGVMRSARVQVEFHSPSGGQP